MADAHREWHRNARVPMGQPGCPQDACHDDYDQHDEPPRVWNADHALAILAALGTPPTSSAITRLITGQDEMPPCYFCEDGHVHTPTEHAAAVAQRAETIEATHRRAAQRRHDNNDVPF